MDLVEEFANGRCRHNLHVAREMFYRKVAEMHGKDALTTIASVSIEQESERNQIVNSVMDALWDMTDEEIEAAMADIKAVA